ncbi:MAG: UDP-N-acetylmuramate--L-alanine ligase [Gemmatimonadota bacterium]|nr:MAG: UDP-N-acetylmuramate--L-alanine ligase [Gemmatimonadota bacterium]
MSALALLAKSRGVSVTGCDTNPNAAAEVADLGVPVTIGHDVDHVSGARAVVYTAAVPAQLPELEAARKAGIPVVKRAAALQSAIASGRSVAIAGTHGKTTTTVMATTALITAGLDPTAIVGGRVAEWGGNARVGESDLFVVEADEYDSSFLELRPEVAVVNNVEADHLECYGSVENLEAAFAQFAGRAQRVLVGSDDGGATRVARVVDRPTWRVGLAAGADLRLIEVVRRPERSAAKLELPDGSAVALELKLPGLHNLRNAAMAVGTVLALGGDVESAARGLSDYVGVARRFQILGTAAGVTVVDDYAHHATELAVTLAAARQRFPGRRLVAVFQPHLYSRTQAQGQALGIVLSTADLVVVTDVYPAREKPIRGVSGKMVAKAARTAGAPVEWVERIADLPSVLNRLVRDGDVVLTLGAGDITQTGPELLSALGGAAA